MGSGFDMVVYHNQLEFNAKLFGDESVVKKSVLNSQWTT